MIYEDEDPFDQLKWLVNELLQAETNRESVHILTHIPTSDSSCYRTWSQQYRRIVERYLPPYFFFTYLNTKSSTPRFANTITGQFNGHTHSDIFSIYYNSSEPTQAVSAAFNGASVVTFTHKNPSYKLYYVDDSSFVSTPRPNLKIPVVYLHYLQEVLDYDEWSYNLTEANLTPDISPRWFKLYSFTEAYGVDDLSPSNLNELAERFARDKSLLEQYYRYTLFSCTTHYIDSLVLFV